MDRIDEFNMLQGFKFLEAYEQIAVSDDGSMADVIVMKFYNDKNVAIEITFIDGEWQVGEPYAIDNEFNSINKVERKEQELERLIKELIQIEKKRNSLLEEINRSLKKLASKEDKDYQGEVGKSAFNLD